jgi:hypothetical protein
MDFLKEVIIRGRFGWVGPKAIQSGDKSPHSKEPQNHVRVLNQAARRPLP